MSKRIKPKRSHGTDWEHFACPDCGDVFKLPWERSEEEVPWCVHNSNYSWRPPMPGGWTKWTEMVKVDVFVR